MNSLAAAQPHDVLCGPFDVDAEYFIVLTNLERFYWNRPAMSAQAAQEFRTAMAETVIRVMWVCSEVAKLPSLVIVHAR